MIQRLSCAELMKYAYCLMPALSCFDSIFLFGSNLELSKFALDAHVCRGTTARRYKL